MPRQRGKRNKVVKEPFSYGGLISKLAEGLKLLAKKQK